MKPEKNRFAVYYFITQGICALSTWNSILTGIDFFRDEFIDFDVPFIFPIPYLLFNTIFSAVVFYMSKKYSLFTIMRVSLILKSLLFFLLIGLTIVYPSKQGFYICIVVVAALGAASSTYNSSTNGFATMFPGAYISYHFIGTGLSGLFMNLLGALFLGIFKQDKPGRLISSLVYFTVASLFQLICYIMYEIFIKTTFAQHYLKQASKKSSIQDIQINDQQEYLNEQQNTPETNNNNKISQNNHELTFKELIKTTKLILIYPILMMIIYIQTFIMFPGVTLQEELKGIPKHWQTIILIATFNFFDTLGKYISNTRKLYTLNIIKIGIALRFVFILSFFLIVQKSYLPIIGTNIYILLNMALFSMLNGIFTGALFIMVSEIAQGKAKRVCGLIMALFLQFGISIGTFSALIFKYQHV